ncbi:hypothetical protein K9325_004020 [Salmonella enterica subsp. enterica serovar Kinondoni]|nr:hypothetical protein [Salmonella enterica subsp. enterica serovar Kinondoni]
MNITFNDIQQRRQLLRKKIMERRAELQECAQKLIQEYKASLCLPDDTWQDLNGVHHQYVMTGKTDNNGSFTPCSIAELQLNENRTLDFCIHTTVDTSVLSGGAGSIISVSLRKEKDRIYAAVGDPETLFIIATPREKEAFREVTNAIKQLILCSFIDPRLD